MVMMDPINVVIMRHGFENKNNGSRINQASLRQLNGYDEQYLAAIENLPIPVRTTALLERVVSFQDGNGDCTTTQYEVIRQLTIGDRVALMLHLRRLSFGDGLHSVVSCPSCRESMSLDSSVDIFLKPDYLQKNKQQNYIINLEKYSLKIRPLTGADQELILDRYHNGDETGDATTQGGQLNKVEELARSSIISSDPPLSDQNTLTDNMVVSISSKLAELDPLADINLLLTCTSCRHSFQMPFSPEEFILKEIALRKNQLEREVHWLAFNYHWSEDAILSLPISKRKRYVDLINKTLAGEDI
jgi:hypothetical protein